MTLTRFIVNFLDKKTCDIISVISTNINMIFDLVVIVGREEDHLE